MEDIVELFVRFLNHVVEYDAAEFDCQPFGLIFFWEEKSCLVSVGSQVSISAKSLIDHRHSRHSGAAQRNPESSPPTLFVEP